MKIKLVLLGLIIVGIASCSGGQELPNPNPLHPVFDLPHYRRDTLNFFHVELDRSVEESVDSIIKKCPLPENLHWTIWFYHKGWGKHYYLISSDPIGNVFISLDQKRLPYKSTIIDGKTVFIIDEYNQVAVDLERPYIRVWNPQIQYGYSYIEYPTWYFEKEGDKVRKDRRLR